MSPLAFLGVGETGEIVEPAGSQGYGHQNGGCREHLKSMGLRPGQRIEMIVNRGCGPLILRLDEARIALGRSIAMRIYVRRSGE
ncbi:MAG: FeoA family protein [Thermodesulfobacteriota bacterium]